MSDRPIVIGLAGGIGSGKSEVAKIMGSLGCVVSDSDAQAQAALEEPAVRDQIVAWWGKDTLGSDGRVDRARVAKIVFENPVDRRRLERLLHPRVRAARQEAYEKAEQTGAPAVVIDAPLLFEAGIDSECDAVVFVSASAAERQARVKASRGWSDDELARREEAQMPLEDKKALAEYEIVNDGDRESLRERVREVFERIRWNCRA